MLTKITDEDWAMVLEVLRASPFRCGHTEVREDSSVFMKTAGSAKSSNLPDAAK